MNYNKYLQKVLRLVLKDLSRGPYGSPQIGKRKQYASACPQGGGRKWEDGASLTGPFFPYLPATPRCEKVKTMEVTSVSIQLEKNFSSFPRQYFALRKILKQLIGELFPKGK